MDVTPTRLDGVVVIEPTVHRDPRGFFLEAYNRATLQREAGIDAEFVQDNHSRSVARVLRGLHYQLPVPQGKLVRVAGGAIWDVAVDLRKGSPSFRTWVGVELSEENHRQLWVPEGFGHGFVTLTPTADVLYKTTAYFHPEHGRSIRWNDPAIGIEWPLDGEPILSEGDRRAPALDDAEVFA